MANGIWINEREFIRFSEPKKPLTNELATRKKVLAWSSFLSYLPNPDPVLKKQGKDISIYRELLSDGHLGSCLISRKAGVKSLEWEIDRGKAKTRQARLIEDLFKDLDLERIVSEILDAPLYGYQPLEVIWRRTGKFLLPQDVVGKPPEWFVFDDDNRLRLKTTGSLQGELLPERKFLLPRHEPSYQNPYGFPLLSRCFWPVAFKRGGLKFWVIFTEKYGMPFLVGKHPRGASKEETDRLADMLEDMIQDAIAVIPDDSSVEIKESSGKGTSAEIYERLLQFCNSEISKALIGQTLTTEVGQKGTYAAAKAHLEVRKDIVDADKRLVEKTLNTLIKWIYELNFGYGEMPVFSLYEEEDIDKDLAERDKTLADTGQIRFTKRYFQKAYGFDDEDIVVTEESAPRATKGTEFAEPASKETLEQQAVDSLVEAISPSELQAQAEQILKPIIKMIQEGTSYQEVLEALASAYPEMDDTALEQMLSRAIFVSEIWGRLNA